MSDAVMLWDWYSTHVERGSCLRQWVSEIWRSPSATWRRSWFKSLETVEKTVTLRVLYQMRSEWCSRRYNRFAKVGTLSHQRGSAVDSRVDLVRKAVMLRLESDTRWVLLWDLVTDTRSVILVAWFNYLWEKVSVFPAECIDGWRREDEGRKICTYRRAAS